MCLFVNTRPQKPAWRTSLKTTFLIIEFNRPRPELHAGDHFALANGRATMVLSQQRPRGPCTPGCT